MIEWTKEMDCRLLAAKGRGLGATRIAEQFGAGFTKSMIVGRYARLRGIVFPSERKRRTKSAATCREHATRLYGRADEIEAQAKFRADQVRKQARKWDEAASQIERNG